MKKINIFYWIITILMCAFMGLGAVMDVVKNPAGVEIMMHLGYPEYLLPFIGVMKILGVVAILIPGFKKIKEWAYAGLFFDLVGALYSHLAIGDTVVNWVGALIGLVLVLCSYTLYTIKNKTETLK